MKNYADTFPPLPVLTREHDCGLMHDKDRNLKYPLFSLDSLDSFEFGLHDLIGMIILVPRQFLFDSFGTLLIKPTRDDGDKRMVIISGYTSSSEYLDLSNDDEGHKSSNDYVFYDMIIRCDPTIPVVSTVSTEPNPFFDPILGKLGYPCECSKSKIHPLKKKSRYFNEIDTIEFDLNTLLGGVPAIDAHIERLYCMDCMNAYLNERCDHGNKISCICE